MDHANSENPIGTKLLVLESFLVKKPVFSNTSSENLVILFKIIACKSANAGRVNLAGPEHV